MIRFDSASKDTDNVFVREKILRVAQRNAFGGAIHIGTIGKNKHIVHVTFKGIPFYPCTKLFIAMVETGKVEAIIINDMRTDKTSINPKQAMRACSQKANTMRWMILN